MTHWKILIPFPDSGRQLTFASVGQCHGYSQAPVYLKHITPVFMLPPQERKENSGSLNTDSTEHQNKMNDKKKNA